MNPIDLAERRIALEVERLFRENPPRYGELCRNPVTDDLYVGMLDPVEPQKEAARRALMAHEQFDLERPFDAPRLPLSYSERERLKCGGLSTIVALYARSLENRNYDLEEPLSFYDYACGVLASEHNGYASLQNNEELRKRFPPRQLAGLGPGLYWEPPNEHARTMAIYRRSLQSVAA